MTTIIEYKKIKLEVKWFSLCNDMLNFDITEDAFRVIPLDEWNEFTHAFKGADVETGFLDNADVRVWINDIEEFPNELKIYQTYE